MDSTNRKSLNQEKLVETLLKRKAAAYDERQMWYYKVDSTVLLASITIFSIVISLSSASYDSSDNHSNCYLLLGVSLNALCVFLSGLSLYSQLVLYKLYLNMLEEQIRSQGESVVVVGSLGLGGKAISLPRFYSRARMASYIIFLVAIIFYTLFVFIK